MRWLRRKSRERDLEREIRSDLELEAEEQQENGLTREEARYAARRAFGNTTYVKEDVRQMWGSTFASQLGQDLHYSLRTIRRNPAFTAAAIVSLALGIGANTAMFSLLDALVLKSLPVAQSDRLVRLVDGDTEAVTYPWFDTLRNRVRLTSGVLAIQRVFGNVTIQEHGQPMAAALQPVSSEYFDVLGVGAWQGRVFHATDGKSPDGNVAVISDHYWRTHYRSSASALGAHLRYGQWDFTVVGIAPPGFRGTLIDFPGDIWVPLEQCMGGQPDFWARARALLVLGRLAPGTTRAQATAEAAGVLRRKVAWEPGANGFSNLRGRFSRPLVVVEVVVAMVLLIACANLANLLLASATARQHEFAVRQAIGAGRGRLVRQLLTENLLVSAIAAALAVAVAKWLTGALLAFLPPASAPALANLSFHLNPRVLGFTAGLALATYLLFGLAPALRATRQPLSASMRGTAGAASGRWMSRGLVIGEVALCTFLLMGAGLFVRTLRNLRSLDSGFRVEHVLVANVMPMRGQQVRPDFRTRLAEETEELRARAERIPGVSVAAFSNIGLLSGFGLEYNVHVDGYQARPGEIPREFALVISPGFFAAMGTPILAGRDFTERDDTGTPSVAIINESFARKYFPAANPLGRRFATEDVGRAIPLEIVALAKDTRLSHLREQPPPMFYVPFRQQPQGAYVTLALKATGDLGAVAVALRRVAREIDTGLALEDVVPFREIEDRTLVVERLVARFSAAFGALALLVGCIGLYGLLACGVARRTREIGVRMAVGATRAGVQWLVLREALGLVVVGFTIGLPCALAVSRYVSAMLYGLDAADSGNMVVALAAMSVVAALAAWIPARRAAGIDPMAALRNE